MTCSLVLVPCRRRRRLDARFFGLGRRRGLVVLYRWLYRGRGGRLRYDGGRRFLLLLAEAEEALLLGLGFGRRWGLRRYVGGGGGGGGGAAAAAARALAAAALAAAISPAADRLPRWACARRVRLRGGAARRPWRAWRRWRGPGPRARGRRRTGLSSRTLRAAAAARAASSAAPASATGAAQAATTSRSRPCHRFRRFMLSSFQRCPVPHRCCPTVCHWHFFAAC